MNTDRVEVYGNGGMAFVGADAVELFRVMHVRSAIKLHRLTGMMPTRGVTITKLLTIAEGVTGKAYKGKDKHQRAEADLTTWIDAAKCAMPVERIGGVK